MLTEPGGAPGKGRAWKIMEALEAHPCGLSAPQLLQMIDVPATSHQQALTKIGNVLRYQLANERVRHAGEIPGAWQRGPAAIWALTPAGHAWLELRRTAARVRDRQAAAAGDPEVDAAIGQLAAAAAGLAAVRARIEEDAAALKPAVLARHQRSALLGVLREARFTLAEIAAITGMTREGARQNLIRQGKGGGRIARRTRRGRTLAR